MKTRIGVGAAAILAAGGMVSMGVGAATASPTASTSSTASPSHSAKAWSKDSAHGEGVHGGLGLFLNLNADSPQAVGDRAAKAAAAIVNHPQLFNKLPAALQADITTLKDAAPADRVADAFKIKTTALSGGYGAEIQQRAQKAVNGEAGESGKAESGETGVRQELRTALTSDHPGAALQKVADQLIGHPDLFAKLPANLQADLTSLKNAAPADLDAQANKIKDTALNGGYGAQVQKLVQSLVNKAEAAPAV
ncbi:hypothetical protein J7I84_18445 [Arthrobacter sp. ISL-85]|uniref:hypothetical protein n=1 Tax=Arthrobacter sp. ISL-85 TaxID=2819115 RepID=UPI001BE8E897|nr:hypothetical protein [Arthrobacter sp. ISL-85]MBT2568439.1 hypothetical protein [Arthrobacter sp. ISL-85]